MASGVVADPNEPDTPSRAEKSLGILTSKVRGPHAPGLRAAPLTRRGVLPSVTSLLRASPRRAPSSASSAGPLGCFGLGLT